MPFVSVTRLRIRSWRYLPAFFWYGFRSSRQAARARGNLSVRLLSDNKRTYWTATAWSCEADMRAFLLAKPHGAAMRRLLEWCDEASVAHWIQPENELPSWQLAHQRMRSEGRASKVNHPSPAHLAFQIPEPGGGARDARFK
jgi:hypothetical protein